MIYNIRITASAAALLLILTATVFGQKDLREGFVVTLQGDTLKGLINARQDKQNSRICIFRSSADADPVRYSPAEIEMYGLTGNKYFVSKTVFLKDSLVRVFAEYLVNGFADLFYFDNGKDHFIVEKEGQKPVLLNYEPQTYEKDGKTYMGIDRAYKGLLRVIFEDKPEIFADIDKTSFSKEPMKKLVRHYNSLSSNGVEGITYNKAVEKVHFRFGPVIGMNFADLIYREDFLVEAFPSQLTFGSDMNYIVGGAINVTLPYINQNVSFQFESLFKPSSFTGENTYVLNDGVTFQYYLVHIIYNDWENKLSVKYTFPFKKLKPNISFGGTMSSFYQVSTHKHLVETITYPEKITVKDSYGTYPVGQGTIGFYGGIGCSYTISKKIDIYLQAEYSISQSTVTSSSYEYVDIKAFSFKTGFFF